jgi:hypothetical protein
MAHFTYLSACINLLTFSYNHFYWTSVNGSFHIPVRFYKQSHFLTIAFTGLLWMARFTYLYAFINSLTCSYDCFYWTSVNGSFHIPVRLYKQSDIFLRLLLNGSFHIPVRLYVKTKARGTDRSRFRHTAYLLCLGLARTVTHFTHNVHITHTMCTLHTSCSCSLSPSSTLAALCTCASCARWQLLTCHTWPHSPS